MRGVQVTVPKVPGGHDESSTSCVGTLSGMVGWRPRRILPGRFGAVRSGRRGHETLPQREEGRTETIEIARDAQRATSLLFNLAKPHESESCRLPFEAAADATIQPKR